MALLMNKQGNRSELQERITAELREKAKATNQPEAERPDGMDDSKFIEGTKQTSPLAWAWGLIILLGIVLAIVFISSYSR